MDQKEALQGGDENATWENVYLHPY